MWQTLEMDAYQVGFRKELKQLDCIVESGIVSSISMKVSVNLLKWNQLPCLTCTDL